MNTVLIIDDAPDIRTISKLALTTFGLSVFEAANGEDGLKSALANKPDLILLDVMMPGMDGPTTLLALREAGVDCPVVFLTAKVQRHEVAEYEALGADAVIAKPFDPLSLADRLREIAAARGA